MKTALKFKLLVKTLQQRRVHLAKYFIGWIKDEKALRFPEYENSYPSSWYTPSIRKASYKMKEFDRLFITAATGRIYK